MKLNIIILLITLLNIINIQGLECPSNNNYDKVSQSCIQCDESCSLCFGSESNQCSDCKVGYFFYQDDNSCKKICPSSTYQNEVSKECINCQIVGCIECESTFKCIKCKDKFQLNKEDGLCYLNENICVNEQIYEQTLEKCVYQCSNNSIEQDEQKFCQNIQECNIVNEYSDYQIKKEAKFAFQLSNDNIILYEFPCKFYVSNKELLINQTIEVLPEEDFASLENTSSSTYFRFGDKAGCVGKQKIVIYDFVQEMRVLFLQTDFKQSEKMIFNFGQENIIIFRNSQNLLTAKKYDIVHKELILFYLINSKKRILLYYSSTQKKGYLLSIDDKNEMIYTEIQIQKFAKAGIVDDDFGVFYISFQFPSPIKLNFYKIIKQDSISIILLFTLNMSFNIFNNELVFYKQLNILLITKFSQGQLMIYKIPSNWESINYCCQITSQLGFFNGLQIINNKFNKDILYINENKNFCFIELNESLLQINKESSISNYKCINKEKYSDPQLFSVSITKNIIYMIVKNDISFDKSIQLITSDMDRFDSELDQFRTSEGYLTYFESTFFTRSIFCKEFIKDQEIIKYLDISSESNIMAIELQKFLYNYQDNRIIQRQITSQKNFNIEQEVIIFKFFQKVKDYDDLIVILFQAKDLHQELIVYDQKNKNTIFSINLPKGVAILFEQPILIKKYNFLLIEDYNILIDLNKQQLISSFSKEIINSYYEYSYGVEDNIFIINNDDFCPILSQFDLKTLDFKLNQYFPDLYVINFISEQLELQNFSTLIIRNYVYLQINFENIKVFSLDSKSFLKNQISINISGIEVQIRIFKGLEDELYLFFGERVEVYSLQLELINTIPFQIQRSEYFNYYKIQNKQILFCNSNYFYKFDLKLQKLSSLKTPMQSLGVLNYFKILMFGKNLQYAIYKSLIVNVEQMQILKSLDKGYDTVGISQSKTDISTFSFIFPNSEQLPIIAQNIENQPFFSFELYSDAYMILSDTYNYINYYISIQYKKIIKINQLNKQNIIEYDFDQQFNFIAVDPIIELFIFVSDKKYLNIYNPLDQSKKIIQLSTYDEVLAIDICPKLKKVLVRTVVEELYIFKVAGSNQYQCKPIYDVANQLYIYPAAQFSSFLRRKEVIVQKFMFECSKEYTKIYYDLNKEILVVLNGRTKNINVIQGLTGVSLFDFYTLQYFNQESNYFDQESNLVIILDNTFSLVIYDYVKNYLQYKQLEYKSLSGFILDYNKDIIYLYDDQLIYAHRFTDLQYIESLIDEKYYYSKIANVQIDRELNIMTVFKENNYLILFDLHEIIYTQDNFLFQSYEINYLEFSSFHYVVYNIRTGSLSLFKKTLFKDIYFVKKTLSKTLKIARLIKIGENQLFYNNKDFFLFASIDTINSKIIKLGELQNSIFIKEMFFEKNSQVLLLIEEYTNNIYELNLINAQQQKVIKFILVYNNMKENKYFSGLIQNKYLIYYSKNNLFQYNIEQKSFDIKQIGNSNISLIKKINKQIDNYQLNEKQENYLNNERISNQKDKEQDYLILIINQDEHLIRLFDFNAQIIKKELQVDYIILNFHIEIQRNLIYIVGNRGYSYIYTYDLKQTNQIRNPCLHETNVLTDNHFIYLFCNQQLDIYNRVTLERAYPTFKSGFQSLHRIIYTFKKDIFIIVQNKSFQIVRLQQNKSSFSIIFEKQIDLLIVANWQITMDANFINYIEIFGISMNDIINYKISLQQQQICTFTFQETQSQNLNEYILKNLEKNMAYSSQLLKQLRIVYSNDIQLNAPILYDNISQDGIEINYFSENQNVQLRWVSGSIFDDRNILNIYIRSVNLLIEGNQIINVNEKKNMRKVILENVKFIEIKQQILFQNFKYVILNNITIDNIRDLELSHIISIQNCQNILIQNMIIKDVQLNQLNSIFEFKNATQVLLKNITIENSFLSTLFSFQQIKNVIIDNINTTSNNMKYNLIEQLQVGNTEISNLVVYNITGGILLKQYGCQYLKFINITIDISEQLNILEILPFTDISVFQSLKMSIQNLQVFNSQDIASKIQSNEVEIKDSNFGRIKQQDKLFFKLQTNILNMTNIEFYDISSNESSNILQIKNFDRVIIQDSSFQQNKIQLIQISNQNEISEGQIQQYIQFKNVTISDNSCKTSLIQIQDSHNLQLINSRFKKNLSKLDGGVFSIQNLFKLMLQDSLFQNNFSEDGKGGCFYLEEVNSSDFQDSVFDSNMSQQDYGGAIYYKCSTKVAQNIVFICNTCQFLNNSSKSGKGGALFLSYVNLIMKNSTISSNIAAIGGGIFYEIMIPDVIRDKKLFILNKFINNTGLMYGNNMGSTLRSIQFEPQSFQQNDFYFENNQEDTQEFIIKNYQSGSNLYLDNLNFVDEEGVILILDQISYYSLHPEVQKEIENLSISIENDDQEISNNKNKILFQGGLVSKYSKNGFNFNVSLSFFPAEQSRFQLTSTIINGLLDSTGKQFIKKQSIYLKFKVEFRLCKLGEIQKQVLESTICEKCPDGKYSINLEDSVCQICPLSAISCSGQQINLKPGYWRKSNNTDVIVACPSNYFSCQPLDPLSKNGCIEGYVGPLCETCDVSGQVWNSKYSTLITSGQCAKCSSNVFYVIINGLIFYIFQFVQILFAISRIVNEVQIYLCSYYMKLAGFLYLSKSEQSQQNPAYQKILIDHLQIISIASSFQLELPSFFSYTSDVVGNPLQISSVTLDCFYDFESSQIPFWFFKFIWSIILPILLFFSYLIFHKMKSFLKLNHNHKKYNSSALIYIYLFFFPSMITLITKSINCRLIGEESYSQIDLNISCREYEKHGKYIYYFIIPFALIFAILIPYILFLKIRNERQGNRSRITSSQYKFLYDPYQDKLYFWDIIRLAFKSLIMIASIILYQYPAMKVCIISTILFSYFSIQIRLQPYKSNFINKLETKSVQICVITINLCLFYLQIYPLSQAFSQITVMCIYIVNGYFIVYLLLFIFLKPIPADEKERNFIYQQLVKLKNKFPNSLRFITIKQKISMQALLNIKKIKRNLKVLAKFRVEKEKNETVKFQRKLSKFMKNSSNTQKNGTIILKQDSQQQLQSKQNENLQESQQTINTEVICTESDQMTALQYKYFSKFPKLNSKNQQKIIFSPSRRKSETTQFVLTPSSFLDQRNYYNDERSLQSDLKLKYIDSKDYQSIISEAIISDNMLQNRSPKSLETDQTLS